jgi:hypothetical protein
MRSQGPAISSTIVNILDINHNQGKIEKKRLSLVKDFKWEYVKV